MLYEYVGCTEIGCTGKMFLRDIRKWWGFDNISIQNYCGFGLQPLPYILKN
jgi:hypothetical protein